MKIGDLVKYYGSWTDVGVILWINHDGGTLKIHRQREGDVKWWVTSGCEIVNATSR